MSETLRLLQWLDQHPSVHLALAGGMIGFAVVLAVRPVLRPLAEADRRPDWRWAGLLALLLIAGRWPAALYPGELNADEGQLLAGAHTLTHDPVFWRSVSGGTAGPLDFYALWPAGWLLGWDSALPARLTATVLLALALALGHQVMALQLGRTVARIASLPGAVFLALTNSADFLHCSTELLPATLLAGAAYAAARRWSAGGNPGWNLPGGVLLGAVPFAKLQAAPLALAAGLVWLAVEFRADGPGRGRRIAGLLAGAITPAGLCAALLTAGGAWQDFFTLYLRFNLSYAGEQTQPVGRILAEFLNNAINTDSLLEVWLCGLGLWLALMFRPWPETDRGRRVFLWLALGAVAVTLGSIFAPRRPFLHYWQLLVVPAGLLLGAVIARRLHTAPARWRTIEHRAVAAGLVLLTGALCLHRVLSPNPHVGRLARYHENPRTPLGERVHAWARPGDTLTIWGWTNHLYAETGLRQGGRDSHAGCVILPGPLQGELRERFLADFRQRRPELFLDTIGAGSINLPAPEMRPEHNFPELAAAVAADYDLVETTPVARIYRRKDLAGR